MERERKEMKVNKTLNTDKVYYLASPYSHKSDFIKELRYQAIACIAARLISDHHLILLEPIASCHAKSYMYDMPTGYEYWKTRDRKMIALSDGIIVATLPGWEESEGVTDEIQYAKELGKDIIYLAPKDILTMEELYSLTTFFMAADNRSV